MSEFVNINISIGEILDSNHAIDRLILKAKDLNVNVLGFVSDNCFNNNVYEYYEKCLKKEIKPIVGARIGIAEKINGEESKICFILYAKNKDGFDNLLSIINNYRKVTFDELRKYFSDLICVYLHRNKVNNADKSILEKLKKDFGDDLYFGLYYFDKLEHVKNVAEINKIVIVNKVYYTDKNEYQNFMDYMNDYYTSINLDNERRIKFQNEYYLKSYIDVMNEFKCNEELIKNTLELAKKVDIYKVYN